MQLRSWLEKEQMTQAEFARELGCHSRFYINRIINGHHIPSRKLALWIENFTNGEVTLKELLHLETNG